MSNFRLARLLRLREREENEAKLRWAAAARASQIAAERREGGRVALDAAYDDLANAHANAGSQAGGSLLATLAAHSTIDALVERKVAEETALLGARQTVLDARVPYEAKRVDVEALERLQTRWQRERRRRRRRREERDRQEYIARQGATNR